MTAPARNERGAIIPMVALMLVALVGMSAVAVDLGMQRVARRDMQSLADAVALDAARLLDGRTAAEVRAGDGDQPGLAAEVAMSANRNNGSTLGDPPTVTAVLVELDAMGEPVYAGGSPQVVAGGDVPDAVMVTASTSVDFSFAQGSGNASRTAVANSESVGCFKLGSYALAVDPANAADTESAQLNSMLGDAFQVSALGYHGLADSSISLLGLATEFDVATPDGLMGQTNIRIRDLFSAMATVLDREGGSAADVTLLETLAGSAKSELDARVDLADLISITSDGTAVLSTDISVLDLVAASAFAADGTHALSVPVLWSVPKFSSGATSLEVIERPQMACGPAGEATARTAQLAFSATPTLHVGTVAGLSGDDATVQLSASLAGATGTLTSVQCGEATAASPESVTVASSREFSTASMTIPINLSGDKKASDLSLDFLAFGLTPAQILALAPGVKATFNLNLTLKSTLTGSTGSNSTTYAVPPRTYADPEPINDSTAVALPAVTVAASDFTGSVTFNGVTRDVATLVASGSLNLSPVVTELNTSVLAGGVSSFLANVNAILTPTAALLGLHMNGADLFGVARPSCDNPALRG